MSKKHSAEIEPCRPCRGRGVRTAYGWGTPLIPCDDCNGTGRVIPPGAQS